MFDIDLPYDRGRMHLSLPDESVVGVLAGRQGDFTPDAGQEELVERALDTPYDSPTLEQLCQGKRDIVIISSDHTRPGSLTRDDAHPAASHPRGGTRGACAHPRGDRHAPCVHT